MRKLTYDRNMKYVREYLLDNPCKVCKEGDPIVLQFHHLRDKFKEVSVLATCYYAIETIQKEIDKCEVLCANCHMRETHG